MQTKQVIVYTHPEIYYWIAECPSLPGVISQAGTRGEALKKVHQAIAQCLETRQDVSPAARFETVTVQMRIL
ncbi:MAG: type II toxin-antitoxin system HicB family antitoxin [Chloroflexota bacterium]